MVNHVAVIEVIANPRFKLNKLMKFRRGKKTLKVATELNAVLAEKAAERQKSRELKKLRKGRRKK